MSSKYGFDKEPEPVTLPTSKRKSGREEATTSADNAATKAAAHAGEALGFVDRTPDKKRNLRLKPGRKRTEEQDRITIPGPKRVIDRLRTIAKLNNVPVWKALEMALDGEVEGDHS